MKLKTLLVACALTLALPAQAALITNDGGIASPQIVDFENYDGFSTTGPVTVAPGVVFTATPGSMLGAYIADLGNNGIWGVGALRRCESLVWLATRRAPRLAACRT